MPFTDLNELLAAFDETQQIFAPAKYGGTNLSVTGYWNSSWIRTGSYLAPTPPTGSGETCGNTTIGGIPFTQPASGKVLHLGRFTFSPNLACGVTLMDRLVHTSGLSGVVATAQTVNTVSLPTRGGTGVGVELWLEWYTTTGSTATTATVSYTNSDGTAGRTSQVTTVPASTRSSSMLRVPLQTGDVGVQSVQSVTLAATTGTAGNFGVTLTKRIVSLPNGVANATAGAGPLSLGVPVIHNNACLFFVCPAASTSYPTFDAELVFIQGNE